MTVKNNKAVIVLLLALVAGVIYLIWFLLRPVEIVAVHQDGNYSHILVKNFPLTEKGKIDWWLMNKDMLKQRYGIPKPASYGAFTIVFWDFSGGYMEEGKYDRRCFADMKPPVNCIEKKQRVYCGRVTDSDIYFGVDDGIYRMKENGEMTKRKCKPNL